VSSPGDVVIPDGGDDDGDDDDDAPRESATPSSKSGSAYRRTAGSSTEDDRFSASLDTRSETDGARHPTLSVMQSPDRDVPRCATLDFIAIVVAVVVVGFPIPQYPDVHAVDRPVPLLPGVDGAPSHPPRPRSGHLDQEDVVIVHVHADAAPRVGEAHLAVVHPPAREEAEGIAHPIREGGVESIDVVHDEGFPPPPPRRRRFFDDLVLSRCGGGRGFREPGADVLGGERAPS